MTITAIVLLLLVAGLWFLVWKKSGMGRGRGFGNRIAEHLGIPKNLFHSLLDSGVNGPSLMLLAALEQAGLSLEQASIELGPSLARGVNTLEARFGVQPQIDSAIPAISRLMAAWEAKQSAS